MKISTKVILQPNSWKPLNFKILNPSEKPGLMSGFFLFACLIFNNYRIWINFKSFLCNSVMKIIAYLIILLEGGALLSYELMAAKMYTPHVGSTLYVWTSILTLTLISLAISYRFSQFLIERKLWKILPISLLISGLYILMIVYTRNEILALTYHMELKIASLFTGTILWFIPIFCMGITSPMISVKLANIEKTSSDQNFGNSAGIIYGIGTLSGVISTLLCLFILMPWIGVNFVIVILALMLILSSILSYFLIKKQHD